MMDRWQRRGLAVSLALHALLLAVLVLGPAFRAPDRSLPDLPVIEFVPLRLVDEPDFRGGQREVQPPPPQPKPPEQAPPEPAVRREPPRAERRPEPAPEPRPEPAPEPRVEPAPRPEPSARASRRLPEVSTRLVRRPVEGRQSSGSRADEAEVRASQEALQQALNRLQELARSSTEVGVPGPGGEAYANYAQYVKTVYTRAWLVPPDLDVEDATVVASVTIARDGTVLSARIIRGSGHPGVDASVQRTLDRVRTIGREFPAGSREDRRTFTIHFNLRAKRLTG